MLHLKDLYCTKIVHILRILRGIDGHRLGQELAAIVPGSYCTRGIWARQEESGIEFSVAARAPCRMLSQILHPARFVGFHAVAVDFSVTLYYFWMASV